jgi:hypothetical protein
MIEFEPKITIGDCIAIVAALFAFFQLRNAVKNSSLTILVNMVTGEFNALRSGIEDDLGAKVINQNETYQTVQKRLKSDKKKLLESKVRDITNHFEMIAISVNNKIINKEICFEYIGLIYINYYRWCLPFIEQRRKEANNSQVLENFSNLALEWTDRIKNKECTYCFYNFKKLFNSFLP